MSNLIVILEYQKLESRAEDRETTGWKMLKDKKDILSKEIQRIEHIIYLKDKLAELEEQGFTEQESIHSAGAIRLQKEVFKAPAWIIETLEKGLKLKGDRRFPNRYEEDNNISAKRNMAQLRDKFETYEREGKVQRLDRKPAICNPLSMVVKKSGSEVKYRPVIDQSRCINDKLPDRKVKLCDLSFFEPFFTKGCYLTSYDLKAMYHQLELHPDTTDLFGCKIKGKNNEDMFYKFLVLAFGNKMAVYVMSKLLGTAQDFFRGLAISTGSFIDDGLIVNESKMVLEVENHFVHKVLKMAGWQINVEKTQMEPVQQLVYQGFVIDTVRMEYRITEEKRSRIVRDIKDLTKKVEQGEKVWAKEIAKVVGQCTAIKKSHGQGTQVGLRSVQHQLGKQVCYQGDVEEPDWNVKVKLDAQCLEELRYVRSLVEHTNGYPIPAHREVEVYSKESVSFRTCHTQREGEESTVFVSDASDKFAFVFEADKFRIVEEFGFSEEERGMGSGHRELQAVIKTLDKHKGNLVKKNTVVYWITDSKNLYQFLKRGSRKPSIQRTVLKIKEWENQLGITVVPIWKPRTTSPLVLADLGSKMYQSTDEWGIDKNTYDRITRVIGAKATVDGFATSCNTVARKFYSKYPQVGSAGIDFFAQKLDSKEVYWLCPPVKEVARCIRHVLGKEERVLAYISFPEWKSQNYWPLVVRGEYFATFVCRFFYSFPRFVAYNEASSTLAGKSTFRFITILVNNKRVCNQVLQR